MWVSRQSCYKKSKTLLAVSLYEQSSDWHSHCARHPGPDVRAVLDHYGPVFVLLHSLSDEPCDTRNILSPQDAINWYKHLMKSKQGDSLSPVTLDTSAARYGDTHCQSIFKVRLRIDNVMPDIHYNSMIYGATFWNIPPGLSSIIWEI